MRAAWALAVWVACVAAGSACREAPPAPAPAPAPPALEVELTGCAVMRAGPVCELAEDRALRLWIKAPDGVEIGVTAGAERVVFDGKPVLGGSLARVTLPASAAVLSVVAGTAGAQARWQLSLTPPRAVPALQEAEALRRRGKLDEARALLEAPLHDGDAEVRAQALGKLARIEKARGHTDEARRAFQEAVTLDRQTGRVSSEASDRFAWSHTLLFGGRRFTEARAVLEPVRALEDTDPNARAFRPYFEGLVAYETGDLRSALRLFQQAAERESRVGLPDRLDALQLQAYTLQSLGRGEEGEALVVEVRSAVDGDVGACTKASLLEYVAWYVLRAREAGEPLRQLVESPVRGLLEALALSRSPACANPQDVASVLTDLALAMVLEGQPGRALGYLREAQRAHPGADVAIAAWWLDIDARIALEGGRAQAALDGYDKLAQIAEHDLLPASRLRAEFGRARALEALGRVEAARAAYAGAEVLLDDQSLEAPLGEGRETFLGRLELGPALHVGFLLHHDLAAAADAARRSRARVLAALQGIERIDDLGREDRARWDDAIASYRGEREALEAEARDDWKLPLDRLRAAHEARREREMRLRGSLDRALAVLGRSSLSLAREKPLPAPAAGELILVYHPLPSGWVGLAIEGTRVSAHELGTLDPGEAPPELSRRLLGPFREAIAGARSLRILAYGPLDRIDWHALPWNGAPLVGSLPVVYGVDLPGRDAAPQPPGPQERHALVVADPREDLPAAREEAALVTEALGRGGLWRVERLEGRAAGHRAVREALAGLDLGLVHYAGHGSFRGRDGWESGLPLAEHERLSLADILALPRVPGRVILSGCETARTAAEARTEGLGLAQAFIVAGAGAVVAATRPTGDRLARRMMAAFYDAWEDGAEATAPEALRRAALAVQRETPAEDWASFRVLVP